MSPDLSDIGLCAIIFLVLLRCLFVYLRESWNNELYEKYELLQYKDLMAAVDMFSTEIFETSEAQQGNRAKGHMRTTAAAVGAQELAKRLHTTG